jgi:hypothetical protein
VDPHGGNEISAKRSFKGGAVSNASGIGVYGQGEASYANKRASGFQTSAVGGLDGHISCNIEEIAGSSPPRYRVALVVNLGARLGGSVGHDRDGGRGSASLGASLGGNVALTGRTPALSDDESKAYVAALRSGNGTGREFEIIRIGLRKGWNEAQRAYLAMTEGLPDPSKMKEGESYQIDKSSSAGVDASLGGKGGMGAIGLSAGVAAEHQSTLGLERKDGKRVYTAREGDTRKLSGGLQAGIGLVSGDMGLSHASTSGTGYQFVVDPNDPEAAAMHAALKDCHSQEDLDAFARKYPRAIQSKTKSTGTADEERVGLAIGGARLGLNYGQSIDKAVTTDAEGHFVERTVTGANTGGAELNIGDLKIGASSTDQAVARVDADGGASLDVTRAESSTNMAKLLGAHVPLLGEPDERGIIAQATGDRSQTDTDDHDTSGMGVRANDLAIAGEIAVNDWSRWMAACPSPRQRDDWAKAGQRIRRAHGDKGKAAEELAQFVGEGNSIEVVYALLRDAGDVSKCARYEFPEGLVKEKPTYDALVIADSELQLDALAKSADKEQAISKGTEMVANLDKLYNNVANASGFTQPAVRAEMLATINRRREKIRGAMRVLAGGKSDVLTADELHAKYNNLAENCVRYQQEETAVFDQIQASEGQHEAIENGKRIKQLHDMYAVWQADYDEMAGLAQEHGFGKDRYWRLKPDWARYDRALTGLPGPPSEQQPETADKRKKAPVVQAPRDPVGDSFRELDKQRQQKAAGINGQVNSAKMRSYGAGNRLFAWIHTQAKPMAIDAHNRGMEQLHRADQDAARVPKDATPLDAETYGRDAVREYDSAIAAFKEGLALYPAGSPPKNQ